MVLLNSPERGERALEPADTVVHNKVQIEISDTSWPGQKDESAMHAL